VNYSNTVTVANKQPKERAPKSLVAQMQKTTSSHTKAEREYLQQHPLHLRDAEITLARYGVHVVSLSEIITSAQYNLAQAYSLGHGVEKNLATAEKWWKAAAWEGTERGSTQAMHALGLFYASTRQMDNSDALTVEPAVCVDC